MLLLISQQFAMMILEEIVWNLKNSFMVVVAWICSLYFMKIMSVEICLLSFSGATAVESRPKSHIFTTNLSQFAPRPKWR